MRPVRLSAKAADGAAVGASLLCLIHCLVLPMVIAFVPALGSLAGVPESAHLLLFLAAVPISAVAILAGYRRHGALLPGAIALLGLVLIGAGALAGLPFLVETSVTVLGSVALAFGHLCNWRWSGPSRP